MIYERPLVYFYIHTLTQYERVTCCTLMHGGEGGRGGNGHINSRGIGIVTAFVSIFVKSALL
jgi:hypothetical protein